MNLYIKWLQANNNLDMLPCLFRHVFKVWSHDLVKALIQFETGTTSSLIVNPWSAIWNFGNQCSKMRHSVVATNCRSSDIKRKNWWVRIQTIHMWTSQPCDICFQHLLLILELQIINFLMSFLFTESTLILFQISPELQYPTITFDLSSKTPFSYSQRLCRCVLEDTLSF